MHLAEPKQPNCAHDLCTSHESSTTLLLTSLGAQYCNQVYSTAIPMHHLWTTLS